MIAMLRKRKNTFVDPNLFTFRVNKGKTIISGIRIPDDYTSKVFTIPNGVYLDFCVTLDVSLNNQIDVFDFNNTPVVGGDYFEILYPRGANRLDESTQIINLPTGVKRVQIGGVTSKFIELKEGIESVSSLYADSKIKVSGEFPKSFKDFENLFVNSSLELPPTRIPDGTESLNGTFKNCREMIYVVPLLPDSLLYMNNTYGDCVRIPDTGNIPDSVRSMRGTFCGAVRLTQINNLPKKLIDMEGAFADTAITTCPNIPEDVQDMSYCFSGCHQMVAMPVLPHGLRIMRGTFSRCYAMSTATYIPDSVIDTTEAFSRSPLLRRVRNLPSSLVKMDEMFERCGNLLISPDLPPLVESARRAFMDCFNMSVPPKLNEGLIFASDMFRGCGRLLVFPVIPSSVKEAKNMFIDVPYAQGDLIIFSPQINDIYSITDLIGDNKQNIDVYCYKDSPLYRSLKRSIKVLPNITLNSIEEHPNYKNLIKEYGGRLVDTYSGRYTLTKEIRKK